MGILGNGVSSVEKGVVGDVAGMAHDEVSVRNRGNRAKVITSYYLRKKLGTSTKGL